MGYSTARMKRKLRKLLADPSLFTRDMIRNRVREVNIAVSRLRRPPSQRRYSVVSAVYNVEPYLDDFFRSLTRQTLGFQRHIEIIMVDDGSPDASAAIISAWQKRYPHSIRYIRKENGGQASARNLGLEHATGQWVTFIDPDDFVDEFYFQRVEELLSRPDAYDVRLVACKMVFYRGGRVVDSHPLRHQFAKGDSVLPVLQDSDHIQLSAASAFFCRTLLESARRRFDEDLKPVFEDAHLIGRYLLENPGGSIGVCSRATYFYRKRSDASSTLDSSWSHPGRFGTVFERGYLDLLRASAEASGGRAPLWMQRTILYELAWHFRALVNSSEKLSFLGEAERHRYRMLIEMCFEHIDEDTVESLGTISQDFLHLVGVLGVFKGARPKPRAYLDSFDPVKRSFRLRYFCYPASTPEEVLLDGVSVSPAVHRTRGHDFLGELFVAERILWISKQRARVLQVLIDGTVSNIYVRGRRPQTIVSLGVLDEYCRRKSPIVHAGTWYQRAALQLGSARPMSQVYGDCLLFIDRDSQADDNAEHLCRYVINHRADLKAFFVLRRDSPDWARLDQEGFPLIPFASVRHRVALLNARHLISSQADNYVLAFPTAKHRRDFQRSRFTFLQHGVIKDDLSAWLNRKDIDLMVTSSPAEYASVVKDGSPYKFTSREVVLSGQPRHDALGAGAPKPERILLIMPTWRKWLVGPQLGKSAVHATTPSFYESDFARLWRSVLHSPRLAYLARTFGFRVQFFPHANLDIYREWFAAPDFVETLSSSGGASMQKAFRSAGIMLTDYSSTAFEMAYLKRAVVYYQFDRDQVFGGGHTTRKGYFDYDRDGFGPVCSEEDALMRELEHLMKSEMTPAPTYLERMDRAFAFRDGQSCQRTLDAILALDRPC